MKDGRVEILRQLAAEKKSVDPFSVGLAHEESGANGNDAWGGDDK